MKEKAYSALASVYEDFMDEALLEEWKAYLLTLLKTYSPGKTGLDVACGSGIFTRAEAENGYKVTGVDVSEEMLAAAQEKAIEKRLNIRFLKEDMTKLSSFEKVDFITVVNDGINYIEPKKRVKTFKNFYKCLKKGGVLLFDFSTKYKLENIIGNELFAEDSENCSYLWFNKLFSGRVEMELSVFKKKENGLYEKKEEKHTQYIMTDKEILSELKESSFTAFCENFLGGEAKADSQRLQIIAIKK